MYKGVRINPGFKAIVYVDDKVLDLTPSRSIRDYGGDCEFGYNGSGPSQLSLAMLYDVTGNRDVSFRYCQDFKLDYVSQFDASGFVILETQIRDWLKKQLNTFEEGI